jgi:hypothetical protein
MLPIKTILNKVRKIFVWKTTWDIKWVNQILEKA